MQQRLAFRDSPVGALESVAPDQVAASHDGDREGIQELMHPVPELHRTAIGADEAL